MPESTSAGKGSALSRRELLKRASALGVAAVVPGSVLAEDAVAAKTTVVHSDALETFSPAQADTVDAIVGRLVPNDAVGPGAVEAGVTQYIDHSLASALQSNANDYTNGLAATDAAATRTYGTTFAKLTDAQKDALLTQMQANTVTGFSPDSRTFFNLIREHSLQGMFGDPHWGGNRNNIGWKLMGFPGISLDIKAADQRTNTTTYVSQYKGSAYDWDEFKRTGKAMS